MSDIVQLHTIGYRLHDVKVTFKHDVKIDTTEVSLDTKFNETLNIPRWIAEILELEKLVDIHDMDMVSELKQTIVKENGQGAFDLSTLSLDFYIKIRSYLKRLPAQDRDKAGSMLNTLIRTRRSKIINFADSSKMTSDHLKKLSIEERIFYNSIHSQSMNFTKEISGDLS
ncbi:MAG: DNA replication complex GINS family protein [Thaumarchaeota archaeon]|nr:DNA replication complex GINS family protein [Nitrososphaerota archaeon]